MSFSLDSYSLKARAFPVVLVIVPAFLMVGYYVTGFEWYVRIPASLIAFTLIAFLLAQLGRDRGKKKEPALFRSWGGKPTTQILRHGSKHVDPNTKARYKARLGEHLTDLNFPSPEMEADDLDAADAVYESCTRHAIAVTRSAEKYPLLLKENINYGFRRNLWAMKPWALVTTSACLLLHVFLTTKSFTTFEIEPMDALVGGLLIVDLLFWLVIVVPEWIRTPAFAYAERLFETVEKPRNE
jgi:hypothetical protein